MTGKYGGVHLESISEVEKSTFPLLSLYVVNKKITQTIPCLSNLFTSYEEG